VDQLQAGSFTVSIPERWFLSTYHAIGSVGVLVLKSLAWLTLKGGGAEVQVSRETLARHCGRSIRTVSRAVAKLKALSLVEAHQPAPRAFECWDPNIYHLTAFGRHLAALLGTGGNSPDLSTRDIVGSLVLSENMQEDSEAKTSAPGMARPENTTEMPIETPAMAPIPQAVPSCGSVLEPTVRALEQAEPRRFAHLRAWVGAKLRAGVSRRHMREALEALMANRERVQSWAGWLQSRLEDLARAEQAAEHRRQAVLEQEAAWRQQRKGWEQERAQNSLAAGELMRLFQAEQAARKWGEIGKEKGRLQLSA
jgi:hypothetical protein